MRVFLTGASGAIGAHVARELVLRDCEVLVLVREPSRARRLTDLRGSLEMLSGDLAHVEGWGARLRSFRPDVAIHLAWDGVSGRYRSDLRQLGNVASATDLVLALADAGCKGFVGIGSQAEYGPMSGAVGEDQPLRPATLYGAAKASASLLAERLCAMNAMRFAWLRLFSTYGPGDDPAWLIPYVVRTLLKGERPALSAGTQRWDYLYVTDTAAAITAVALDERATGYFNLGSGQAHAIKDIVEQIRDLIDPGLPLEFGELAPVAEQTAHLEARVDRLRQATGWRPTVSLHEGLARTIAWWRGVDVSGEDAVIEGSSPVHRE